MNTTANALVSLVCVGFENDFMIPSVTMKLILAKSAGFCSGVRRGVEMTLHASAAKEGRISTFGPLVHNPQVIELLSLREVECIENIDDLKEGLTVIRSHGIPLAEKEQIQAKGLRILDATCPKVSRVQKLVQKHVESGCHVIIVGEADHPEVKGLLGYGQGNCTVISSVDEVESLPKFDKVCLLAQTTQNSEAFEEIRDRLAIDYPDMVVRNTICASTAKRQNEIREIASKVDAMIVIGGRSSGNTKRLVQISKEECGLPTFWVETDEELSTEELKPFERIGITAGASTPSWIIDRVMSRLHQVGERRERPVVACLRRFVQFLVITNLYTSFAAGCLCYLGSVFLNVKFTSRFFWLVFCYVLAMHVLNRFTETGVEKFRDDPMRQQFYKKYQKWLLLMGIGAMVVAIAMTIQMGVITFIMVLAASIVGMLYSVKVVPKKLLNLVGFRRLKDIAASKNFFVASAWAVVSIFPLFFIEEQHNYLRTFSAFIFLFLVTGIRSVYMDLSDIGSDRLVGRDSVPIVLGEKRTREIIQFLIVLLFIYIYLMTFLGILPGIGYIIGMWLLLEYLIIVILMPKDFRHSSMFGRDILVDGHFIVAGVVALLWSHF